MKKQSATAGVIGAGIIGSWTAKLLRQLKGHRRSLLTPVSYWRDPMGRCSAASGFPIIFNARLTGIYGLPSCEYPGLVKMLFHGGPESDPDTCDLASFEPYVKKVTEYVRNYLPDLDHTKPAIQDTCMYTNTGTVKNNVSESVIFFILVTCRI